MNWFQCISRGKGRYAMSVLVFVPQAHLLDKVGILFQGFGSHTHVL